MARITVKIKEVEQGFLSVTELAKYAGISRDVQSRLRNEGILPFYIPWGVKIMYKKAEIDRIIDKYKVRVTKNNN